jgi:hypothetical protein
MEGSIRYSYIFNHIELYVYQIIAFPISCTNCKSISVSNVKKEFTRVQKFTKGNGKKDP